MKQAVTEGIEMLRVSSYRKLSPFGIPLAAANMSGAMLAMELVCYLTVIPQTNLRETKCFSDTINSIIDTQS